MIRRIEVYPTRRIASRNMELKLLQNEVTYFNKPSLELTTNGAHYIYIANIDGIRGRSFDQIYIHPDCANRLAYIIDGRTKGAKIVLKMEDECIKRSELGKYAN